MSKLDNKFLAVLLSACGVMGVSTGYMGAQAAWAETITSIGQGDLSAIGKVATVEEVAAWDHDVRPDGLGLPKGSGSVELGEEVYTERCSMCHGVFGEGAGRWPELAGGHDTLLDDDPVKTIGSYWPYLSTVWDYINEAMPFGDARSLSNDEIYAITAYLLNLNDLVDYDFVLSDENFQEVRLPNENGFYHDDRDEVEVPLFSAEACMTDCRDPNFEITAEASAIDVTPDQDAGTQNATLAAVMKEADDKRVAEGGAPKAEEGAEAGAETSNETSTDAVEAPAAASSADPELIELGSNIFKKCKACHSVEEGKNGTGPHLAGILDRPIGGVEGFKYSKDMAEAGGIWDDATLRAFLTKPKDVFPKTKMSFAGLKEQELDAMLAYLSSL